MANAFVQAATGTAASGTTVANTAFGSSTTTGNLLVASIKASSGGGITVSSIADTASNGGWQRAGTQADDGGGDWIEIWYCMNATGGASFVATATLSGSVFGTIAIHIHEVSGAATSSALDEFASDAAEAGTAVDCPAITPDTNGQYIFATVWGDGGTFSPNDGLSTERSEANGVQTQSYVQPTIAAHTAAWTQSTTDVAVCVVASFRAAAAAGGSKRPLQGMSVLGVS